MTDDDLHLEAAARGALAEPADWDRVWRRHFRTCQEDRRRKGRLFTGNRCQGQRTASDERRPAQAHGRDSPGVL
jgi:hypothetical protein